MSLPSAHTFGLIYLVAELALTMTKRAGSRAVSKDRRSLRMLWIVILASVAVALVFQKVWPSAIMPHRAEFFVLGFALFVCGLGLRGWSVFHLGRYFTVDVSIAAGHRLIDSGPYRRIRHPAYTGSLLALAGLGFCYGNFASLLAVTIPVFLAFRRRIEIEEAALRAEFGDTYRAYMQRTRRLVPGVY